MTEVKPYPRYKDSGVEWLGRVPTEWEVPAVGRFVQFRNGTDYSSVELEEGGFPVYGSGGAFRRASSYLFDGESVLFGRKGTIDKPLYVDGRFWTVDTMYYTQISTRHLAPRFLYYWATQLPYSYWTTSTALPSMTQSDLATAKIPCPLLADQHAIAAYLDRETAEIDAFIADQEELIRLLTERRVATIGHAVTGGLASRTSWTDSGVDWIGAVPSRWTVRKLNELFRTIGSGTTPPRDRGEYYGGGIPWVTTGELREKRILNTEETVTPDALRDFSTLRTYPRETVLIAMYGATVGRLGILGIEATTNQACCALAEPRGVNARFIYYALLAAREHLLVLADGGGQPNINQDKLRQLRVPVPPLEEQDAIVVELDRETTELDAATADAREAIALSRERRAALISAAVTGKFDVRAHANGTS